MPQTQLSNSLIRGISNILNLHRLTLNYKRTRKLLSYNKFQSEFGTTRTDDVKQPTKKYLRNYRPIKSYCFYSRVNEYFTLVTCILFLLFSYREVMPNNSIRFFGKKSINTTETLLSTQISPSLSKRPFIKYFSENQALKKEEVLKVCIKERKKYK